jgi:hypothetical protein
MPDFTVIEGGGKGGPRSEKGRRPSIDEVLARDAFRRLVIELLRDLTRDYDSGFATTQALIDFVQKAGAADVPVGPFICETISEFRGDAFGREGVVEWEPEAETKRVLEAALKVTVEYLADDGFAKGRRSQRLDGLQNAIEAQLLGREKRSRAAGWSYLKELGDRLGKWSPRKK